MSLIACNIKNITQFLQHWHAFGDAPTMNTKNIENAITIPSNKMQSIAMANTNANAQSFYRLLKNFYDKITE